MLTTSMLGRASAPSFFLVAASLLAVSPSQAQAAVQAPAPTQTQTQAPSSTAAHIASLAQRTATALDARKTKRIAIPDFAAASGEPTMDKFGAKLAADFRAALAQQPHKFTVVSDADLTALLAAHRTIASDMQNLDAASWLLHQDKIDSWAVGMLAQRDGKLVLAIGLFHRDKDKAIYDDTFEEILGAAADLKPLDEVPPTRSFQSSLAPPDGNGMYRTPPYSIPTCEYCPQAHYSDDAVKAHLQGVVTMNLIVSPDGSAENIQVVKRMPLGLTEQAVAALKTWRFKPATNSDGTPVAVKQLVEMQFHLY